jgi:hypothetical protein
VSQPLCGGRLAYRSCKMDTLPPAAFEIDLAVSTEGWANARSRRLPRCVFDAPDRLARPVYAAQKTAQVPGQGDADYAQKFNSQAVARQDFCPPTCAEV